MGNVELLILAAVCLGALWLLWSGRRNSPKHRERDTQLEALYAEARKILGGDIPPPPTHKKDKT